RQGLIPLFILLCFPFTPNTLINFVASLSHIRPKYYFIVLASSKLVSTIILGYLGKEITTILTHPLRGILMLVVLIVFWIVGKKLEQHFMGSKKE
ncbi:TPA: TVP38/TMEM64 family protein, partial [Staphylococcus aureus]|nr:TVP38/TMEM64 family protein [Staphylococcus aureus]